MAEHLRGTHRTTDETVPSTRLARSRSIHFSPGLWIGVALALLLLLYAAIGPVLFDSDPGEQQLSARLMEPAFLNGTWDHPFGTDQLGRDIFVRMAVGLRYSLAIGLTVTLIASATGVLLGLLAAIAGPNVDRFVGFLVNVQIAIPAVILAIAAAAIFRPGTGVVIGVLAVTGWVGYQRVVRATTKSILTSPFVEASRSMGGSRTWVARKHLLPNALGPIIVIATQQIAAVMLFEAALSYLGLGVPTGTITLGGMVAQGREAMLAAWWVPTLPGVAIALSVLSLNLIGDGLRRRLDPRSRSARS